jgi:hypothetical protein
MKNAPKVRRDFCCLLSRTPEGASVDGADAPKEGAAPRAPEAHRKQPADKKSEAGGVDLNSPSPAPGNVLPKVRQRVATVRGRVKRWLRYFRQVTKIFRCRRVKNAALLTLPVRHEILKVSGRGTSLGFQPVASGAGRTRNMKKASKGRVTQSRKPMTPTQFVTAAPPPVSVHPQRGFPIKSP